MFHVYIPSITLPFAYPLYHGGLNIHRNTVANKLDGGAFTIEEAFVIKEYLFRQFDLSYLFKRDVVNAAMTAANGGKEKQPA